MQTAVYTGGATPWGEEAQAELPELYTSTLQSDCHNLLRWLNQKAVHTHTRTHTHTHTGTRTHTHTHTQAEHAVFRRGIAQALLSPIPGGAGDGTQTVVAWALRVHSEVPDSLQTGMEDLIHSLLVLPEFKANFCSTFSQLYLQLLERRHCYEVRNYTYYLGSYLVRNSHANVFSTRY